jgi:S-(hydroxymethyl)glutathione dehydrogenase/alcohol dehydrogenase
VTVVPQHSVVPIHPSIDLATAALITCGVLEGLGAATRAASIAPGDVVVVIGNRSVGRNALQGARFAGAGAILVLGEDAGTLEEDLGATHATVQPAELEQWIRDLTQGRGADVVIDTAGAHEAAERALGWTRRGGQVVLTTADSAAPRISLDVDADIVAGARSIRGGGSGTVRPREEVPILLELHESGLLRLDWPRSVIAPIEEANSVLSLLDIGDLQQARLIHS